MEGGETLKQGTQEHRNRNADTGTAALCSPELTVNLAGTLRILPKRLKQPLGKGVRFRMKTRWSLKTAQTVHRRPIGVQE